MLCIIVKNCKQEVTQELYDEIINNLDLNTLPCPKCDHYGVKVHGYYDRPVKTKNGVIRLVVLRVKCPLCNSTHAVLIASLVPYQSLQLKDQIRIINNDDIEGLLDDNSTINEKDISRVKYNYNHYYKEMLASEGIALDDNIVVNCFKYFKRQFLQIKRCFNLLCT